MKPYLHCNYVTILFFSLLSFSSFSQTSGNVGIGTVSPQAKLEVKNPLMSAIKIRSSNFTDSSRLIFSNRNNSETGTDFIFSSNQEGGMNISSTSDLLYNTKPSIMLLTPQGNVGINNPSPLNKLDVNGDVNISGLLKINGSPGTTGQVLMSNGASAAAWQNTAFSNTTRFAVSMPSLAGDGYMNFTTNYNTTPADITINPAIIYINHSGLYHFEGMANALFDLSGPASFSPRINMSLLLTAATSASYNLMYGALTTQASATSFLKAERFYIDLYVIAGTHLSLTANYSFGGSATTSGWFSGYLISD